MVDQVSKYPKILEQLSSLASNDERKDITFEFKDSDVKIKAHKFILQTVSSTFTSMYTGAFKEKDSAVIHDIHPKIFQMLIDGIYMKPINMTSIDEAIELYHAAEMYDLDDLKNISKKFMIDNLTIGNCFYLFQNAKLFGITEVAKKCIKYFKQGGYAYDVLISLMLQKTEINEDSLVVVNYFGKPNTPGRCCQVHPSDINQIVEFLYETGKLKTYKKVLERHTFLQKLLMDSEELLNYQKTKENDEVFYNEHPLDYVTNASNTSETLRRNFFWFLMFLMAPVDYRGHLLTRLKGMVRGFPLINRYFQDVINVFERKQQGNPITEADINKWNNSVEKYSIYKIEMKSENEFLILNKDDNGSVVYHIGM